MLDGFYIYDEYNNKSEFMSLHPMDNTIEIIPKS